MGAKPLEMFSLRTLLPLLALALAVPALKAQANVYVVDSTVTSNNGACTNASNDCPLGAAITLANNNFGPDTIVIGETISTIAVTGLLPDFTDSAQTTITAPSGLNPTITRNGGTGRLFLVETNGNLALFNLVLRDAVVPGFGGLVNNGGTFFAGDCRFIGGRAGAGGAISNFGGSATIQRCLFEGNVANDRGGAIYSENNGTRRATFVVTDSAFRGNLALSGGAVYNLDDFTVRRSSFVSNAADADDGNANQGGGGIYTNGSLLLESSTFFLNSTANSGGGVYNRSILTMRSCTLSENRAAQGGALANAGDSVVVVNTIFNRSENSENVVNLPGTVGAIDSAGYNISSDASGPATSTDRRNLDPLLPSTLSGPTDGVRYLELPSNSPAVDQGNTNLSPDTRGQARPVDFPGIANASGGNGADVGAFELTNLAPSFNNQVVTLRRRAGASAQLVASDDANQTLTFSLAPGASLPAGVMLSSSGLLTINPATAQLGGTNVSVQVTDNLGATATALVTIDIIEAGGLVVNSRGADNPRDNLITLREAVDFANADGVDSVITFNPTVFAAPRKTILLSGGALTLQGNGNLSINAPLAGVEVSGNTQSGVFEVEELADVTMTGLTIRGGRADVGAGINNNGNLTLEGCTMRDNVAIKGGAIFSFTGNTNNALILRNCTLTGNSASGDGGALFNSRGSVSLDSCTIVSNTAPSGAGVASFGDDSTETRVRNCIIQGNSAGQDVSLVDGTFQSFASRGFNLIGEGSGEPAFRVGGDATGGDDAELSPLADNGGPVQTRLPLPGSLAINQGSTVLETDARGVERPQGSASDRGAVEVIPIAVALTLTPRDPFTNDTVTSNLSASGGNGGALTFSYVWRRNGAVLAGETGPTLNLQKPGNGDKGDTIELEVTVRDSNNNFGVGFAFATIQNSAPIAISSKGEVPADTLKAFVLNAFDADGDPLTYKRVGGPRSGVADIRVDPADGKTKLFYKSRPFYGGVDIIRFVVFDSSNKQSNESTLGINVLYTPPPPVNRAPIAGDTNIDTFVGTSVVKGLLGSDPDGDALTFRVVNNARYGSSVIKRDSDGFFKLFYTSLNRFYGPDRVTYIVTDSRGKESNLATVSINFINRSPVALGNFVQAASGELVSQFLFANDPDNDAIRFRLVNNPRYGKGEVKLDAQGKWRFFYQSLPGYVGPDRITFIAIDPFGKESSVAVIDINVVRVGGPSARVGSGGAPSGGGS